MEAADGAASLDCCSLCCLFVAVAAAVSDAAAVGDACLYFSASQGAAAAAAGPPDSAQTDLSLASGYWQRALGPLLVLTPWRDSCHFDSVAASHLASSLRY